MSKCPIEKISVINEPFEQWAERVGRIINKIYTSNNKFFKHIYIFHNYYGETYAINMKYNKFGFSRCHRDDDFNKFIGITIAFYRMMGWELPRVQRVSVKHMAELRMGDKMLDFTGYNSDKNYYDRPTFEFVCFYNGFIIVWDIEKEHFRSFIMEYGKKYEVLEED